MKRRSLAFILAFVMILGCFAGLGAAGLDEEVDFAALSVDEQYSVLMSLESDEDAMALFATLDEEQRAALSAYAEAQLNEEEAQEDDDAQEPETKENPAVNFTNVAPFVKHNSSPAKARMLAKAAGQTTEGEAPDGIKLKKTATPNGKGGYTIKLEAYTTGTVTTTSSDKPTDIVLVLDQSGSMARDMGTVNYKQYEDEGNYYYGWTYHTRNQDYYEYRHNDGSKNLWYKLSDGSYVSVSVERQEVISYKQITSGRNNSTNGGATNYWNNRDNLYALVNGQYQKVSVSRTGNNGTYTYRLPNDTIIATSNGRTGAPNFTGIDGNRLYLASIDDTQTVYTYTYTDSNGTVHTIGTSTGANERFTPAFYQRTVSTSGGGTRLDALKKAAKAFVEAVNEKAKGADKVYGGGDDVDHRIAIVGFSSNGYNNTELLTGSAITEGSEYIGTEPNTYNNHYFPTGHEMNGPQYGEITDAQYKNALQQVKTAAGFDNVKDGIDALTAYGGTMTQDGLDMANKIFEQNPLGENEKRNRVVVVFTDGVPGLTGYDSTVAASAIEKANTAKNTYGATVYTIGIFSGADATSAGDNSNKASETQKANWFMHNVSSNNGTVQNPSYYLSASDSDTLSTIFEKISDQISSSDISLGQNTVIRDVVTKYFDMPANASAVSVKSYECTGFNVDEPVWSGEGKPLADAVTINSDTNTVDVTRFDFNANYVTKDGRDETDPKKEGTFHGRKLVIEFDITVKDGFVGGNNVPTNGTSSGVYDEKGDVVAKFEVPKVNIDITPSVKPNNKVIYEGSSVNVSDLYDKENAEADDSWKFDFVNVSYAVKQGDTEVTDTVKPADCTDYTVSATFTPKYDGQDALGDPATEETAKDTATVHVLKPTVTVEAKDVTKYYGESYTPGDTEIKGTVVWKDENQHDVTTTEPAPYTADNFDYSFEWTDCLPNNIVPNKDTTVKVTAKVGDKVKETDYTVFAKTCTLTVNKSVEKTHGKNDSFIFNIVGKGNVPYEAQVVITGNGSATLTGLPIGEYTVKEDTNWSWRYKSENSTASVTLSPNEAGDSGEVTIKNSLEENQWLGKETFVINKCEQSTIKKFIEIVKRTLDIV